MKVNGKVWYMVAGAVLALVLVFGAFTAFAQSGDDVQPAQPETETEEGTETTPVLPFGRGFRGGLEMRDADGTYLADALGITVEELDAARDAARVAAIEQAVADGLITQEQADLLLSGDLGFHGRMGFGRFGEEGQTFLADALGITVEELRDAQLAAMNAHLADLVEAGYLTQDQADLMLARKAANSFLDREALAETVQDAYEAALADAVAAGAITQAQADALLANIDSFGGMFGRGMFDGGMFGGRGRGGHHGGMGGFHGFGDGTFGPPALDSGSDA